MKIYAISALIMGFLFLTTNLFAQNLIDDTKTIKVLVFEHETKNKTKLISQGGRIRYKLRSNPKVVHKGTVEDIKEGMMIVDGREVPFDDCLMIGGRVTSEEMLTGGIVTGSGFTALVLGFALIGTPAFGLSLIAGGTAALVVGIILITKIKRFKMDKGWDVHSGKIQYSATN